MVNTVKDANFVNSLAGKIAGLQINASASGTGGSTRVVMRGVKSISGNNNALYVIDGIPMPDLRSSQTEGIYETPDGGDFEGISNLNPEDIGVHVGALGRDGRRALRFAGRQRRHPHHDEERIGRTRPRELLEQHHLLVPVRDAPTSRTPTARAPPPRR